MSYDDPVSADEVVRSIAAGAREGMAQVMQLAKPRWSGILQVCSHRTCSTSGPAAFLRRRPHCLSGLTLRRERAPCARGR